MRYKYLYSSQDCKILLEVKVLLFGNTNTK